MNKIKINININNISIIIQVNRVLLQTISYLPRYFIAFYYFTK
jgi:hypothetical protein